MNRHFSDNKESPGYFASVDLDGNAKALQTLIGQARKLDKAVYLFSVDAEGEKVVHVNYVPKSKIKQDFDARSWANGVVAVLGGKASASPRHEVDCDTDFLQAGGKEDSAQGVGTETGKLSEAVQIAEKLYLENL